MNFNELFELQNLLDESIKNESPVVQSILPQKLLSLEIQIGELASTTECCKNLNNTTFSDKKRILEKYINCLSSILSIGVEKGFTNIELNISPHDIDLTEQFLNLFLDINDLIVCNSKDHYITLLEDFFALSFNLNLELHQIKDAYIQKNKNVLMHQNINI